MRLPKNAERRRARILKLAKSGLASPRKIAKRTGADEVEVRKLLRRDRNGL